MGNIKSWFEQHRFLKDQLDSRDEEIAELILNIQECNKELNKLKQKPETPRTPRRPVTGGHGKRTHRRK